MRLPQFPTVFSNAIMFLVGLTGGIASGKSTVANIFKEHSVPIIDGELKFTFKLELEPPSDLKHRKKQGESLMVDAMHNEQLYRGDHSNIGSLKIIVLVRCSNIERSVELI